MLEGIKTENVLFIDIETAPAFADYKALPDPFKKCWDKKAKLLSKTEEETPEAIYDRAGIYAEFGKIICICAGFISLTDGRKTLRIKSFSQENEIDLLTEFTKLLNTHFNKNDQLLCAHNGKEFDFPYLIRRMLINGLPIPRMLDLAGKKPWEVPHLDTMELWKFGDYKNYTSLELLAAVLGIPTPKDDIEGSDVCRVYWKEKDLPRIVKYCCKDVITIVQIFLRYQGKQVINEDDIIFA